MDKTLELVVIALLGALCSILANKGIADLSYQNIWRKRLVKKN